MLSVDWLNLIFVSEVWRGMLGFSCIPSLLFFFILFFIPESPRWLILKGRDGLAKSILQKIYLVPQDTTEQLQEIKSVIRSEVKFRLEFFVATRNSQSSINRGGHCYPWTVYGSKCGTLLWTYHFLEEAGLSGGDALFSQVLVGVVNAVTTVIAVFIIDKVGRKKLVYYGVSGMILSLLLIGFYFSFAETLNLPNNFLLFFFLFYVFVVLFLFVQSFLYCFRKCILSVFVGWQCL